ncbi:MULTISPECIES: prepilin-type N-terminal cleavage/methylation domain-containing protein [Allobacillus]|uniref:Type II secretion system protein n=1 Tax=Allobacillus salarius TaxID=1955272 RepID=A0A556PPA8_9BACI|nr:type II secretion system protein [Allobacillus salarius]TSJ66189.1 type II secretion system protein [Allobacillus salarius]
MKKYISFNERGFTLIEILGALTILSIVLLGLFTLFPQSANFQNINEDKLTATNLSNLVLEDMRNLDANELSPGTYEQFNTRDSLEIPSVQNDGQFIKHPDFSLEVELRESDDENILRGIIKILHKDNEEIMRTYYLFEVTS